MVERKNLSYVDSLFEEFPQPVLLNPEQATRLNDIFKDISRIVVNGFENDPNFDTEKNIARMSKALKIPEVLLKVHLLSQFNPRGLAEVKRSNPDVVNQVTQAIDTFRLYVREESPKTSNKSRPKSLNALTTNEIAMIEYQRVVRKMSPTAITRLTGIPIDLVRKHLEG